MKILSTLILLFINSFAFTQDTIVKVDGTTYLVKIIDIENNDLQYLRLNQLEGPMRHMDVNEVAEIRYKDGRIFKQEATTVTIVKTDNNKKDNVETLNSEMLPGYHEIKPYLVDFEGNLTEYHRVGYHTDYLMAYETENAFKKIPHGQAASGTISKKSTMFRFINGRAGVSKGKLVIKSPSRTLLFVMAAEGKYTLLCNGLMDYSKYTRSGVGAPGGAFITTGVNEVAPVHIYYLYDGEELIQFKKEPEEIEMLKDVFKNCPGMVEAIDVYLNLEQPRKKSERQAIIENLFNELADIFYKNCYLDELDK